MLNLTAELKGIMGDYCEIAEMQVNSILTMKNTIDVLSSFGFVSDKYIAEIKSKFNYINSIVITEKELIKVKEDYLAGKKFTCTTRLENLSEKADLYIKASRVLNTELVNIAKILNKNSNDIKTEVAIMVAISTLFHQ